MVKSVTALSPFIVLTVAAAAGPDVGFGIGSHGASKGLLALLAGIVLIVAVPLFFFATRKTLGYIRSRREKSFIEEQTLEAQKREDSGEFVSAALAYEKLNNLEKAAELYRKGGDFTKAADAYESMGLMEKVGEMYELAGDLKKAAEARMYSGDFPGAARIFNQLGDKIRAAGALERSGNMLAAARAYREAKDYLRASALLKKAGMNREAAEMYAISLAGSEVAESNLDKFYAYASLLEAAGDTEKAAGVFRTISEVKPGYKDVRQRLESSDDGALSKPEPAPESGERTSHEISFGENSRAATTLRSLIRAGAMEPRHSFRIWFQTLKALEQKQREGRLHGVITPEVIVIDSGNNVTFSENTSRDFAYTAPEVVAGAPPDAASSVYSMGLILYEMLTGSLDTFGIKNAGEVAQNVPSWLEELTVKCCARKRQDRYQGIDEIMSVLVDLKKQQQE